MAITVPTSQQIVDFWGEDAFLKSSDSRISAMAQLAADLLWLATSLDNDPGDPRWFRLEQAAIMDLTIFLLVSRETPSENYTGMQSERIGSYSYSKAMARSAIAGNTGALLFDRFVTSWNAQGEGSLATSSLVSSEQVFTPSYTAMDPSERLLHPFTYGVEAVLGI